MPDIKPFNVQKYVDQVSLKDRGYVDWHSMNNIVFASLLDTGWDWGRSAWSAWNVSDEAMAIIRPRINRKIEERYYQYELGSIPPAAFAKRLKSRIESAVTKRGFLYQQAFEGIDFSFQELESLKRREINSKYPEALLMTQQEDYLSDGQEEAFLKTLSKAALPGLMDFMERVEDPDEGVLEDIKVCFSQIFSEIG